MLNKQSPVPIYFQLEEMVRNEIEEGKLKAGDMIPSERDYSERFDVSRMTVRQAITNLVNQGYLYRVKGKGTFVQAPKIEQKLQGLTSFTEEMKAKGLTPSSQILFFNIVHAMKPFSLELGLSINDQVFQVKRLRLADQVPMAVETICIPYNLLPNLTIEKAGGSLYELVEKETSLKIDYAKQEIEATVANETESKLLQIPKNSPTLTIKRICYLEGGVAFESANTVFRGDRYKFTVNVKR
jgi:GntR family transcriptional regulator